MSNNVAVEFTIGQRQAIKTEFKIEASPSKVSQLENDLEYQTKTDLDTALATKQDILTAGEGISIENNVISATGATITVDDELSTTSENPVQNKVVTSAINQNHTEIANIGQTIGTYGDIVTHNASEFATSTQGAKADTALQPSALNGYATQNYVDTADQNLQSQIDAISASSDVTDIVGTYAELQAYDTSKLKDNDIIKVLQDESQNDETTYYRWDVETETFLLIGEEGPYYTKSQADTTFVPQTRTVNGKALSSNITLTASDVSADASGSASTAETNAKNYADSLASNYATSAQGALADTALQPNDIANMQTTTNLVTSVSSASTDTQYPSAKLFYDICGDIETLINAL